MFDVTVRKSTGRITTKEIDAPDASTAKAEGARYGSVLHVKEIRHGFFRNLLASHRRKRGFNQRRQLEFLQTMSNMLVGYTLGEALAIMTQNFKGVIRDACMRLRRLSIDEQMDPVDALRSLGPKYLPQVTIAIIKSNAKVGALHEAFREGLAFQREILKLQSSHMMILAGSILKFLFSMSLVILNYFYGMQVLEDADYFTLMPESGRSVELMAETVRYIDWSGYGAMAVMGVWTTIILIFGAGRDASPRVVERWLVDIPLLNGVFLSRINFMATYQIHKLLSKGVPLMDSLRYVSTELNDGVLKEDFDRVLGLMERGDPEWIDGFHSFSDLDRALLKSANHMDEMSNVFSAQSDQFLASYDQSVKSIIRIHDVVSAIFLFVLIVILTLVTFLPMVGGFDLVEQG